MVSMDLCACEGYRLVLWWLWLLCGVLLLHVVSGAGFVSKLTLGAMPVADGRFYVAGAEYVEVGQDLLHELLVCNAVVRHVAGTLALTDARHVRPGSVRHHQVLATYHRLVVLSSFEAQRAPVHARGVSQEAADAFRSCEELVSHWNVAGLCFQDNVSSLLYLLLNHAGEELQGCADVRSPARLLEQL